MPAHIVFDDGLEFFGYLLAFQRHGFFAIDVYRRDRHFARTGQRDADIGMLGLARTCMDSTPGYWLRHTGIWVRK